MDISRMAPASLHEFLLWPDVNWGFNASEKTRCSRWYLHLIAIAAPVLAGVYCIANPL